MQKEAGLKKISALEKDIEAAKDEIADIAEKVGVVEIHLFLQDISYTYFPEERSEDSNFDPDWYDDLKGRWVSSSEMC